MGSGESPLSYAAAQALTEAFGAGSRPTVGIAPGRCTLVGEHVDYADGWVLAVAVDRFVAAAARPSRDGAWRMISGARRVERRRPEPCGDAADRAFAVAVAMERNGIAVDPVELGVAATLPEGAGLSSSAALSCAVALSLLRLGGVKVAAGELAATALTAERDVAGVQCGPLDQRVVVGARSGAAMLLDCAPAGGDRAIAWLGDDVSLVACHTGESHDIGGHGYRTRRHEAAAALRLLGAASYRGVDATAVDAAHLPEPLNARARHIVSETARALAAAAALEGRDAAELGRIMTASGESLRVDYDVTTPALDACVDAALAVPGCLGARMVGGGFGGSVVAFVHSGAAQACMQAMERAVTRGPAPTGRGAWLLKPTAGVAERELDVVAGT